LIETEGRVEATTTGRECFELLKKCDAVAPVVVNFDGLKGNKLDAVKRIKESGSC
jgi:hypothetical protein